MMMVMVVVMMVVVIPAMRHHDDGPVEIGAVMMMVVMMILRELDGPLLPAGQLPIVERLQLRCRIRDRVQKLGVGIGPQHVGGGGLRGSQSAERRHRSQNSGDL